MLAAVVTCLLIALYVVGGLLEALGLASVAYDFYEAPKRAARIGERRAEHFAGGTRTRGVGHHPTLEQLERELDTLRMNWIRSSNDMRDDLNEILVGRLRLRVGGLAALALGLVMGVIANVLSATR